MACRNIKFDIVQTKMDSGQFHSHSTFLPLYFIPSLIPISIMVVGQEIEAKNQRGGGEKAN